MKPLLLLATTAAAGLGLVLAAIALRLPRAGRALVLGCLLLAYLLLVVALPEAWLAKDLLGIAAAAAAGAFLASLLGTPQSLVAFVLVAAVVDTLSVFWGPSAALLSQDTAARRAALVSLTVVVPLAGRDHALLGLPDIVGLAAVFSSLRRSGYPVPAAAAAPLLGIVAAVSVALAFRPLPAYPFLAAATLAVVLLVRPR
jgi:hypothetical protein